MATPTPPDTDPIPATGLVEFALHLEVSAANMATLDAYANALIELTGTVTPPTFTHALKVTVSRQIPVTP